MLGIALIIALMMLASLPGQPQQERSLGHRDGFAHNQDPLPASDDEGRGHANIDACYAWNSGLWKLLPFTRLRWKSSEFNNRHFGLDGFEDPNNPGTTFSNQIGSGWDLS
ncbi:MAG: hypothetical protein KJP10_03030, partial [Gammaproteobacteria bacterium]|nr:hypothetical protein [Gammaproteobacteria bacterium]